MAPFALAYSANKSALEDLFGRKLGQTPYRHRSWMWWTALRTIGASHLWDEFASLRNSEGTRVGMEFLRSSLTDDQWARLRDRTGPPGRRLKPSDWNYDEPPEDIWTRGGVWHRANNYTKIIVLGQHLEGRDYSYNSYSSSLGPSGAMALEREIHNFVDEESQLYPHAIRQAVSYVRERMAQMVGYTSRTSAKTASWFFQEVAPSEYGGAIKWTWEANYPRKLNKHSSTHYPFEWFPDEAD